ncbi:MAG: hypothetical protein N4A46_15800 [Schleiferiaceae bacterium]|jgi:membrane-associated HD superfamily phosphohydrolase|nr:hypothetical protein [Schleiferiaceae bacterium]
MEDFIAFFGHSFHSAELNSKIESLGINYPDSPFLGFDDRIISARASNAKNSIYLSFQGSLSTYPAEYGNPKKLNNNKEGEEIILMEITIEDNTIKGVLGLAIGNSQEEVLSKIGTKPYKKEKHPSNANRVNWFYDLNDYKLQIHFTEDEKVAFIRASQHTKKDLLSKIIKQTVKEQKKNIQPENVEHLNKLLDFSLIGEWINQDSEESKKLKSFLSEYIENLKVSTSKKSSSKIYSETNRLVKQINKLNHSSDFIETAEREDLCDFISKAVKATGFEIPSKLDITEEHRMW